MINTFINLFFDILKIRRKPRVLQMPITSRCNSRCKTCNIWKLPRQIDINPARLSLALNDNFFSEVKSVGVNGGEPSLVKNLNEIIEVILNLKKIKYIHLISNGLLPHKLLQILKESHQQCKNKNVKLGFTLSVDGVNEIHESVRGVPNSFKKIEFLLDEFKNNSHHYCDTFIIGCTISKYNIPYIRDIESFLADYNFPVDYHIAVPNKRIHTFNDYSYSLLSDERSRLLATEYFYGKYLSETKYMEKFKYFSSYYFLKNRGHKRLMSCPYHYQDVTIDEELNLSLCATASDFLGNLNEENATSIRKRGELKRMAKKLCNSCNECIHYKNPPSIFGGVIFFYEHIKRKLDWSTKFKYLVKW